MKYRMSFTYYFSIDLTIGGNVLSILFVYNM